MWKLVIVYDVVLQIAGVIGDVNVVITITETHLFVLNVKYQEKLLIVGTSHSSIKELT